VAEALASEVEVLEVSAEPDAPGGVLESAAAAGIPVHAVEAGSLARATSPVTPQPVAALAVIPAPAAVDAVRGLVLVLVGVADPGNAGTLVRIAEAAGATAVVSCADAVDVWNPKCVRAAAGSLFRVPHAHVRDAAECIGRLREAGMTLLACDAAGAVDHDATDLTGDVAVLLGNEAHGLTPDIVAAADRVVRIPMEGSVESLNVAMTGAVVAFEAARQRRRGGAGR
jgi:TrmH family RNA methyltransferase